jgi:hypothetical protein
MIDSFGRHNPHAWNILARTPTNQYAGAIFNIDAILQDGLRQGSKTQAGTAEEGSVKCHKEGGRKINWDGIPGLFRPLFFCAGHYDSEHGSRAEAVMHRALRGSVLLSGTDRHGPETSTRASSTERGFFFFSRPSCTDGASDTSASGV